MGVLPLNFVDGDILTAANVNQMNTARAGFLKPIDPTTRNEDDNVEDLGSASNRWKDLHANGAVLGSKDDVIIGGQTLTQILEDNRIDSYASLELFRQVGNVSVNNLLTGNFTKQSGDLILRVMVNATTTDVAASTIFIALSGGIVITREYNEVLVASTSGRTAPISFFQDIFDISGVTDGANINVVVNVNSPFTMSGSAYAFKNAF